MMSIESLCICVTTEEVEILQELFDILDNTSIPLNNDDYVEIIHSITTYNSTPNVDGDIHIEFDEEER